MSLLTLEWLSVFTGRWQLEAASTQSDKEQQFQGAAIGGKKREKKKKNLKTYYNHHQKSNYLY